MLVACCLEHVVLLLEEVKLVVTDRTKLDFDDDLEVRHHHSYASKQCFQVLGQFLSTGVTRIHGDKEPACWNQVDQLWIARKHELCRTRLLGIQNRQHHLSDHRQNRELDAIKLVEATPQPRHAQTLEDLGTVH